MYVHSQNFAGGFSAGDGTVEFFSRVNALVSATHRVLDLGGGRGGWIQTDPSSFRRALRDLKSKCTDFVVADIDDAVLSNPTSHRNVLLKVGEPLPFDDGTFDLIVSDYVLEHVEDPQSFAREVDRILKPGGYFCARTPHKYQYVSLAASLIPNSLHRRVLKCVQPSREEVDVFPTAYRLNTLRQVRKAFQGFEDYTYLFPQMPSYYFNSKSVFRLLAAAQALMPPAMRSNVHVFVRKPCDPDQSSS